MIAWLRISKENTDKPEAYSLIIHEQTFRWTWPFYFATWGQYCPIHPKWRRKVHSCSCFFLCKRKIKTVTFVLWHKGEPSQICGIFNWSKLFWLNYSLVKLLNACTSTTNTYDNVAFLKTILFLHFYFWVTWASVCSLQSQAGTFYSFFAGGMTALLMCRSRGN